MANGGSSLAAVLSVVLSAATGIMIGVGATILLPPAGAPAPSAEAAPVSSAQPPGSASAPPAASASAPAPPPETPATCLQAMFPDDTFVEAPAAITLVCDEPKAIKGASRLKEVVVKAGTGRVSGGMKEWAILGHYGIATYASMRSRCCPGAAPLEVPASPEKCGSMQSALEGIGAISKAGSSDADVDAATETFRKTLVCSLRNGSKVWGDHPTPGSGEATAFRKTVDRTRADR